LMPENAFARSRETGQGIVRTPLSGDGVVHEVEGNATGRPSSPVHRREQPASSIPSVPEVWPVLQIVWRPESRALRGRYSAPGHRHDLECGPECRREGGFREGLPVRVALRPQIPGENSYQVPQQFFCARPLHPTGVRLAGCAAARFHTLQRTEWSVPEGSSWS
jgi:hypothetical protein